jgi:GntR family transcriptional regulator, transcriptional repressor for pyruvate dehydrogenase complex
LYVLQVTADRGNAIEPILFGPDQPVYAGICSHRGAMLASCTMTRQQKSAASRQHLGNRAILAPLAPARNLSEEMAARLRTEIASGHLSPGTRLPTEQDMMQAMGVSRTVVREAVAALKAEGFVTTRQGSGAFVATDRGLRGFRIDSEGLGSLADVLHVLDLRLAIEVQAAVLASERATVASIRVMRKAHDDFAAAIGRGEAAIVEDFAFHRAIAAATANPHFSNLLQFLGHFIIPRQSIHADGMTNGSQAAYMRQILGEHEAIVSAISARDADKAHHAMRAHLVRSRERYRSFAVPAKSKRAKLAQRELATTKS